MTRGAPDQSLAASCYLHTYLCQVIRKVVGQGKCKVLAQQGFRLSLIVPLPCALETLHMYV